MSGNQIFMRLRGRSIGLVGYSRGAFIAISVAGSAPPVRAVVD
jgi:dienelactone hydrolase